MNEMELKYGCNPNQKPSRVYMEDGSDRSSGSYFLQACFSGRCRSRSSDG